MREIEMTAKTVEEAVEAACRALGVDRDDWASATKCWSSGPPPVQEHPGQGPGDGGGARSPRGPGRPASTRPRRETAAAPAPAPAEAPVAARAEAPAPAPAEADAAETPLDIAADEQLQAAVDYLTPIFTLLGAKDFAFSAVKQGEATILRVQGEHLGALIGRRGETMESLSYLASLVVNRMDGPYVKLGIDVGGYRGKREGDLYALARRIAERVQRTGCCYEMEPMNPYERHIIHTAISAIEGVRSESKGEGNDRRVVIYSTDPDASNLPDRGERRPPPRPPP